MIIFEKYTNNTQHCWYDSSNIVYSECKDNSKPTKNVKITFKGGRTYLYKDVSNDDYIRFRQAESNGKVFNECIKKYETVRLMDIDLNELESKKQEFLNEDYNLKETFSSLNLMYVIKYNDATGEFTLLMNDKPIFNGVEGQVSIINLFRSMSLNVGMMAMTPEEIEAYNREKTNE